MAFLLTVKTLFGLEPLLAAELQSLGATDIRPGFRQVSCQANQSLLYRINLGSRTAIRVLKPIHTFQVGNETNLYNQVKDLPWDTYLKPTQTLAVDATLATRLFNHSHYIALKTKDAIVDHFRERYGIRPDIDVQQPDIRVQMHIHEHTATVSLDSSGSSLHLRGYRKAQTLAPLNEVLAAGLLLWTGWEGNCDLLDPMCGSGTLLIEAALIAMKRAPNLTRPYFAFQRWNDWNPVLFDQEVQQFRQQEKPLTVQLRGYDNHGPSLQKARLNVESAGLDEWIRLSRTDFFTTRHEKETPLVLVCNPPYDERLSIDSMGFYKQLGDTFKQGYAGADAWVLSGNREALKHVGLKADRKLKVYNGAIETLWNHYSLYAGSRKHQAENKDAD